MANPCKVCGGTDLNLVDGFYYCIECGTQDQTARETMVERTELIDGTFAIAGRRKLTKNKSKVQMSGEWYKWHAYNFILCGLTDELIALGAKPSLKSVVLWIWTRYMKKYCVMEDYQINNAPKLNKLINNNNGEDLKNASDHSHDKGNPNTNDLNENVEAHITADVKDIRKMTVTNIYGILYVALNLDKSDIQLSHFLRYIKEGRLTFLDSTKYIPSDCNLKKIPQWKNFLISKNNRFASNGMLHVSAALFIRLELGTPMIPDLKALVSNYVKELCLPKDFLQLVLSLFEFMPIEVAMANFLKQKSRFPDFESIAMSYVLVALKMCFGLDDDYEIMLSDVVDKVNQEENHLKSYRIGITEPSDRLFSFREWITYLEFRKIVLCQYYQPMASKLKFDEDNFIVSELLKDVKIETEIKKVYIQLGHELLKRIPLMGSYDIIAKEQFPVSHTPLTTYTQFLMTRIQDEQTRFLLSEDFSKYSLKYAYAGTTLKNYHGKNVIQGVSETNKTTSDNILGTLRYRDAKSNTNVVFIKDTDNKDWIKDFEAANAEMNNKKNLNDDDSKEDILSVDSKENKTEEREERVKCEKIEELDEEENIFNDHFDHIEYSQQQLNSPNESLHQPEYVFEFDDDQLERFNNKDAYNSKPNITSRAFIAGEFDPTTFDRGEVIKRLLLIACRKYKITIPREREARKRKVEDTPKVPKNDTKKRKTEAGIKATEINDILTKYHSLLHRIESPDNVPTPAELNDTNASELDNEPDLNTTVPTENSEEPQHFSDETNNEENQAEPNNAIENSDNDSEIDVNELLEENHGNFADCLDNNAINKILMKELSDFEFYRVDKLKSLKETLQRREMELKQKQKPRLKKLKKKKRITLDPLVSNPDNVQEFQYYMRHYTKNLILTNPRRTYGFETELTANHPKSFRYLIQLCASIIEVPAWNLFRIFQYLEIYMMKQV